MAPSRYAAPRSCAQDAPSRASCGVPVLKLTRTRSKSFGVTSGAEKMDAGNLVISTHTMTTGRVLTADAVSDAKGGALRDERLGLWSSFGPDGHAMSAAEQGTRERGTHRAQPEQRDVTHRFSPLGQDLARARRTHRLADHPQDVVQRIAVAVQVKHRGEPRRRGARRGAAGAGGLAAEQAPQQAAEPASLRGGRRIGAGVPLLRHVACHQHRQDREHLLEQGRVEPRLRRRVLCNRAAHVLGAEDLSENVIAAAHVRRLRRQHVIEQAAAAELPEQTAEPFEARGL